MSGILCYLSRRKDTHHFCGPAVAPSGHWCQTVPRISSQRVVRARSRDRRRFADAYREIEGERAERPACRARTQDTIRILVAPVGDEVSLVERDVSLVTPEVRSGIEGDGVATEFFRRKFSSTKCLGEEKSEISAPRAARGIHLTSKVSRTSAERPMDKGVGDSEHAIWTSTHAASDQAHGRNQGG